MKSNQSQGRIVTKSDVEKYFDTYNRDIEEGITTYYAEDAIFENLRGVQHVGHKSIVNFLKGIHYGNSIRRVTKPTRILIDGNMVAAEIMTEVEALRDIPEFFVRPVKKGEVLRTPLSAHYDLKDGKIVKVVIYSKGLPLTVDDIATNRKEG